MTNRTVPHEPGWAPLSGEFPEGPFRAYESQLDPMRAAVYHRKGDHPHLELYGETAWSDATRLAGDLNALEEQRKRADDLTLERITMILTTERERQRRRAGVTR